MKDNKVVARINKPNKNMIKKQVNKKVQENKGLKANDVEQNQSFSKGNLKRGRDELEEPVQQKSKKAKLLKETNNSKQKLVGKNKKLDDIDDDNNDWESEKKNKRDIKVSRSRNGGSSDAKGKNNVGDLAKNKVGKKIKKAVIHDAAKKTNQKEDCDVDESESDDSEDRDDDDDDDDDDSEEEEEMDVEESGEESDDADEDSLEDDSSSDSSSSEDDDDDIDSEGRPSDELADMKTWTDLVAEAQTTEDSTSRLAVCNMDWERVSAVDLFVAFSAFKPLEGVIKSVKVYPSDFGLERMKVEDEVGPARLIQVSKDKNVQMENLRRYELDKLKYYYAVIDCDSTETADALYKSCDGMEFLRSGVMVDFRFIPEDMTFDRKPRSVAASMPRDGEYKPPKFQNKALHNTNVELTWDNTPDDRVKAFRDWGEKLSLEEIEARMRDYIAPPSDEEEDDEEARKKDGDESITDGPAPAKKRSLKETMAIYRGLLDEIDEKEAKERDEKSERDEVNKKFLEELNKTSKAQTDKKSTGKDTRKSAADDDEEEEEMHSMESGDEESDEEEEEEEEEEVPKRVKGKKISNKKLMKMKIKEKKKQKMGNEKKVQHTTEDGRFVKMVGNKDFSLDEKVTDKTTKMKQRRILSAMKRKL